MFDAGFQANTSFVMLCLKSFVHVADECFFLSIAPAAAPTHPAAFTNTAAYPNYVGWPQRASAPHRDHRR
jgi:hypothetical protein